MERTIIKMTKILRMGIREIKIDRAAILRCADPEIGRCLIHPFRLDRILGDTLAATKKQMIKAVIPEASIPDLPKSSEAIKRKNSGRRI
jgi:hypothetical protein